jgi:NADH-quinone oxidoreductase subunit A
LDSKYSGCFQTKASTGAFSPWDPGFFSLLIYGLIVLVLITGLLWITSYLGQKKSNPEKARPYESGIIPTGSARIRFPVPFYLVAIFFLIFDVEGAFIFSWAIASKILGWVGWLQITFFIVILMGGLAYIWRKGGIDWGPDSSRP